LIDSLKLEAKFLRENNVAAANVRYMERALPKFNHGGQLEKMKYLAERNDSSF